MNVKVLDRLTTVFSGVDHSAKSLRESFGTRDFSRSPMQMSNQRTVFSFRVRDRGNVLARNDQYVHRRLRFDVDKGVALIVLVNGLGWNAPIDNLAEEAAHGQLRVYRI